MSPPRFAARLLLAASLGVPLAPASAQDPPPPTSRDTAVVEAIIREAQQDVLANARVIKWYHVAVVFGAIGASMALDEPIQRYAQEHRSSVSDDISTVFRQPGEPLFYGGIAAGTFGIGLVSGNADIRRTGGRMMASVALAGIFMAGGKRLIGRSRPNENAGAFVYHPFTSLRDSAGITTRSSMPSGHTTAAFALATTVAADVHNPIVDVLIYTFAAGTGFSRISDNRHWLSDVLAGMALGVTSGKLVSGQWRIFNLRPPGFLLTPTGTPALTWTVPLGPVRLAP